MAIVSLSECKLDKKQFQCSSSELNNYFHHYASQDEKRNLCKCYVLIEDGCIAGLYTLSASSIKNTWGKVKYDSIPVALLGRMAIDERHLGKGFGQKLIMDCFMKIKKNTIGVSALIVHAKDESAISFYRHFGFEQYSTVHHHLLFPLSNIYK